MMFFCRNCEQLLGLVEIRKSLKCINPACPLGQRNRIRYNIVDEFIPMIQNDKSKDHILSLALYRKDYMDDDIRIELNAVGKHVEDIGRQIASTKSSVESVFKMRELLREAAETVDIYLQIQISRWKDVA